MALTFIKPALPTLVDEPPAGDGWLHEIKHDGYRTELVIDGPDVKAFSRRGLNWSWEYRLIVDAARRLKCASAILDGEVIVQDENGISSFNALQNALAREPGRMLFVGFDLLHLNGEDLRSRPIEERRAKLQALIGDAGWPFLFSDAIEGDGRTVFAGVERLGLEGIVSKRKGSVYRSGPAKNWFKTKSFTESVMPVIGVERTPKGSVVALLATETDGRSIYAGNAFLSLGQEEGEAFWTLVAQWKQPKSTIKGMQKKGATWVRPGLHARVRHLKGGEVLRHATVRSLEMSSE